MMCETEIRCWEQLLYTWTGKQMETYNLSDISDANTAFTLICFVWKIFRKQIFKIFLTLGPRWSFYCFLNSASDNLTFDSTASTVPCISQWCTMFVVFVAKRQKKKGWGWSCCWDLRSSVFNSVSYPAELRSTFASCNSGAGSGSYKRNLDTDKVSRRQKYGQIGLINC